jgi:hypothetical protein
VASDNILIKNPIQNLLYSSGKVKINMGKIIKIKLKKKILKMIISRALNSFLI